MWSTSNGEQKGAYSLIPFNRLSGNFLYRMGGDVYGPLQPHANNNCIRMGIRIDPH